MGIFSVISKGAATNPAGTSQTNGFLGVYLKFAGFDSTIVQGQAKKWCYLYIQHSTAKIYDVENLIGNDTYLRN
ncbi:hypothetical protein JCM39068_42640 [Desulfocastanea catecholica]